MMLKVAKRFIIVSMIFYSILIFPLIIGIIALKKMDEAKCKDDLLGIGIVTLLFCNIISGIIMICVTNEDVKKNNNITNSGLTIYEQKKVNAILSAIEEYDDNNQDDNEDFNYIYDRLAKLKKLHNDGIIDDDTYNEQKNKYLDKI